MHPLVTHGVRSAMNSRFESTSAHAAIARRWSWDAASDGEAPFAAIVSGAPNLPERRSNETDRIAPPPVDDERVAGKDDHGGSHAHPGTVVSPPTAKPSPRIA